MFGFSKKIEKIKEPDWESACTTLIEATLEALKKFSLEYPEKPVSDICYDSEPSAGYVLIAFNTEANDIESFRKRNDESKHYARKQITERYDNWQDNAHSFLKSQVVRIRNGEPGYFDYQDFANVEFPEWVEYTEQDLPERPNYLDDYLETKVAYLFWKVFNNLVERDAFDELSISKNFQLSYCFHDQSPVHLFVLNT